MPKNDQSLDALVKLIKSTLKYVDGTATVTFRIDAKTLQTSKFKLTNDAVVERGEA